MNFLLEKAAFVGHREWHPSDPLRLLSWRRFDSHRKLLFTRSAGWLMLCFWYALVQANHLKLPLNRAENIMFRNRIVRACPTTR